jgi:ribonuclease D
MREFTGRASRSQIDRWWDAIQVGMTTTDLPVLRATTDSVPPPRAWPDKNPAADLRLKAARVAVTEKSTEVNIPVENLLTPELLRRLAWAPPEPIELGAVRTVLADMGARAWQVDTIAAPITEAFVASASTNMVEPSEGVVGSDQTTATEASAES